MDKPVNPVNPPVLYVESIDQEHDQVFSFGESC